MRSVLAGAVVVAGVCGLMATGQAAESKPVSELPRDLVRWSTLWMDVPQAIYDVGVEEGPVAAMMWGPVMGTARLVSTTTRTLREVAQEEQRPAYQSQARRPAGVILQYEF